MYVDTGSKKLDGMYLEDIFNGIKYTGCVSQLIVQPQILHIYREKRNVIISLKELEMMDMFLDCSN